MPTTEHGPALPLRPALVHEGMSPKSGPAKVVSIDDEPEEITPLPSTDSIPQLRQFKTAISDKRMTGRPNMQSASSSRLSVISQGDIDEPASSPGASATSKDHEPKHHHRPHMPHLHHREHREHKHKDQETSNDKLLQQVAQWLQAEKAKRAARKASKRGDNAAYEGETVSRPRTYSQGSDSSGISLEKLQMILEDNMSSFDHENLPMISPILSPRRPSYSGRRRRSSGRYLGAQSSDTEYQDGDVVVPSCEVVLDNSKTMSYSGGAAESSSDTPTLSTSKRAEKERKAWSAFKMEIVRLAHTLRLKGWRQVPLDQGGEIEVERLSGALTNAVYVVSPPKDLPAPESSNSHPKPHKTKPPPKLLLRIYGPQVEHLIDRENELSILRRLARKKIGPRLLGTFKNGRFEEFFNAQTLTFDDLRIEDTSKQIAKRMRELHDGIDLLSLEREEGPFVWRNWDKWVDRCEEVITYLDKEILSGKKGKELWRKRGLICGTEWSQFKAAINLYRKWLDDYYANKFGGVEGKLVFAHNDTQYGNILRLVPEAPSDGHTPSPLLLPQNTHKQLVVIDFEYASANTPGLEFANHFTEWCYNYHHAEKSWACNTENYPTLEQQTKFIRSYVNHRPQFNPRASATPKMTAMDNTSKGSISEFLLDSRTPGGTPGESSYNYQEDEARREQETEERIRELLKETHIWRVANSAQWVAWGIVQAKVPELDDVENFDEENGVLPKETNEVEHKEGEGEEEDEFDYLAYARDRAMFFWGDIVGLGIVKKEDLPEDVVRNLKIVEY